MDPTTYAEMRPGAYDINERVRDMNHNGILASMCFPSFVGFSGGFFQRSEDKDLALDHDPGVQRLAHRRVGRVVSRVGSSRSPSHRCGIPRRWSPRSGGWPPKGCHAITMPELPHIQGLPSYHDIDYWDPFFRARVRGAGGHVPAHRSGLRRHQLGPRRADRQPDHPGHPGLGSGRPGPAVGTGLPRLPRPRRWRGPRRASAGSRSTSTAATGTTPTSGGSATTSASKLPSDIFRDHSLACYVIGPDRPQGARATSASTSSPGSATTPTPTRFSRRRPSSCTTSLSRRAAATKRSTRSPGRTPAGSSTGIRSEHIPRDGGHRGGAAAPVARRRHHHPLEARVARALRDRRPGLSPD